MTEDLFKPAIQHEGIARGTDIAMSPANDAFERFWETKPQRDGPNPKGDAKSAFLKLVSRKVDPESVVAAAREWAEEERKAGNIGNRFVKQAVAWLNQFGREVAFEAKEPPTKKTKSSEEAVAKAAQLGWKWNGERMSGLTPTKSRAGSWLPGSSRSWTGPHCLFHGKHRSTKPCASGMSGQTKNPRTTENLSTRRRTVSGYRQIGTSRGGPQNVSSCTSSTRRLRRSSRPTPASRSRPRCRWKPTLTPCRSPTMRRWTSALEGHDRATL